nr:hypothetical protein HK105_001547 [Polyrhizophydium stewartii]
MLQQHPEIMALVARMVADEVARVQATGEAGACRATVRAAKRQADPGPLKVAAPEQHASPPPSALAPPPEVPGLTTEVANQEALELADRRVQEMILSPEAQGLGLTTMVRTPTATPAQIKAVAEVINSLSEGERPAPGLTQVDLGARYRAITKCAIALRSLDSTPVEGAPPHLIVGRLVQKWGPSESNALLAAIGARPARGCYPAALLTPGLLARALLESQNGEIGFYARKRISAAKLTSRTAPEFRMLVEELRELDAMAQDLPGFEKLAVQQLASELSRGATLIEQDRIKQAREAPNLEAAISLLTGLLTETDAPERPFPSYSRRSGPKRERKHDPGSSSSGSAPHRSSKWCPLHQDSGHNAVEEGKLVCLGKNLPTETAVKAHASLSRLQAKGVPLRPRMPQHRLPSLHSSVAFPPILRLVLIGPRLLLELVVRLLVSASME